MLRGLSYIIILFILTGCARVPMTGRRQLNLVSNSDLLSLSKTEYNKVLNSSKIIKTGSQAQMLARVGVNLQKAVEKYMNENGFASNLDGFDWEFNLIDNDSTVNAWAMPGGKVAFYTGIMPYCKDEVGIAVVMGHEVSHAIARHGAERMSQGLVLQFGFSSFQMAMGQDPSVTEQIFLQSLGVSSQLGILAYSRKHESEADKMGIVFMAMAGYDPREAPIFWERMAKSGGGAPPEWMSTHPSNERRIADLNANMAEALQYYNQ